MKICMYSLDKVFNKETGGVRRFLELMNALIDAGHEVYLYSADDSAVINENHTNGHSINKNMYIGSGSMVGLKVAFDNKELFQELKENRFDRIVVFDVKAAFSLVINRIRSIHLFLRQDLILYKTIQLEDNHVRRIKRFILLKISIFTERLCLKNAKQIIVQCKFDLNRIISRHPLMKSEILSKSIIQINNINPSWVSNDISESRIYNYERKKEYDLVFVGNFKDSRKGHDLLLPALQQLGDDGFQIKTAIIGDGKQLLNYKKRYADCSYIEFLGRLTNPNSVIVRSKMMIVPSYVDSCPNTIMEALYYQVPVIGANRSGIPEILNNPEWLFEMNVESIKKAIKNGLNKKNNDRMIHTQLSRRNELMFDWGKKMAEIVEQ